MFTKRPDKHTTGLINLRNDCFANSSLQAYSSLPGFTEYLNKLIGTYRMIERLVPSEPQSATSTISDKGSKNTEKTAADVNQPTEEKSKPKSKYGVPLHIAMARMLKKLQETQLTTRTISVWTFLHELEKIFNAKISRSQHDAHELTQLINETLENENISMHKRLKNLLKDSTLSPVVIDQLRQAEVPDFPFGGLILTQMVCLKCKNVSKPSFAPFLMLTLHTPEVPNTDLSSMVDESEQETIDGYQCLNCRVSCIVENEKKFPRDEESQNMSSEEKDCLSKIFELSQYPKLFINDDLPENLEKYIKSYDRNGLKVADITSKVLRKNQILKPPKIFGIHLSRSSFNGVSVTRNACRVSFKDSMTLSIGQEYHEELKQFQQTAESEEPTREIKSKILTTDVNDMEDEDVQREDIDEKGDDEDDTTSSSSATEGEEIDEGEESDDSLTSQESLATTTTVRGSQFSTYSNALEGPTDTLNNTPISKDQTAKLRNHFKSFKFNDNDVYRYKLRAVIRHQGSHTQGHYECYKKKPLFVKDKEGTIFKLAPEILDETIGDDTPVEGATNNGIFAQDQEFASHGNGHIRRKFSNMMGRRPSVVVQSTHDDNIQEVVDSGLATPAEIIVENKGEGQDYFNNFSMNQKEKKEQKVKLTKIPTLIKNPYWRISDSQVNEVSRSAVLFETASVYMLYYERVDRKQVRG